MSFLGLFKTTPDPPITGSDVFEKLKKDDTDTYYYDFKRYLNSAANQFEKTPAGIEKFKQEIINYRHPNDRTAFAGYTLLHLAATENCQNCLKLLVDQGANTNSKTTDKNLTPLHLAALYGRHNAVNYLLPLTETNTDDLDVLYNVVFEERERLISLNEYYYYKQNIVNLEIVLGKIAKFNYEKKKYKEIPSEGEGGSISSRRRQSFKKKQHRKKKTRRK